MPYPCAATDCTNNAVIQWVRRPTDDELAQIVAAEEARRAEISALYPDYAQPEWGPLPTAADCTMPVFACGDHEIDMDLACHIHQAVCTAPNPVSLLPGCNCDPEPLPPPVDTEAAPAA